MLTPKILPITENILFIFQEHTITKFDICQEFFYHIDMVDKNLIYELIKQGFSYTDIAKQLKVSKQRIWQIVNEYKNMGRTSTRKHFYRDMGLCELCNISIAIVLHHKDGNNKNDINPNLEKLCLKCHGLRHKELNKSKNKNDIKIINHGKFEKLLLSRGKIPENLKIYLLGKDIKNI